MDQFIPEISYLMSTMVALFVIIDPFAVVPVYLSVSHKFDAHDQKIIRRKATLIATAILLTFALFGTKVFSLFGITIPAFQIAGGILLMSLGLQQLNSKRDRIQKKEEDESMNRDDISVFPLAMPLLAGPGAISTVVLYSSHATSTIRLATLALAIVITLAASYLVIKSAPLLFRILGRTGLNLVTRIMGILLVAISVQFVINGVAGVMRSLGIIH